MLGGRDDRRGRAAAGLVAASWRPGSDRCPSPRSTRSGAAEDDVLQADDLRRPECLTPRASGRSPQEHPPRGAPLQVRGVLRALPVPGGERLGEVPHVRMRRGRVGRVRLLCRRRNRNGGAHRAGCHLRDDSGQPARQRRGRWARQGGRRRERPPVAAKVSQVIPALGRQSALLAQTPCSLCRCRRRRSRCCTILAQTAPGTTFSSSSSSTRKPASDASSRTNRSRILPPSAVQAFSTAEPSSSTLSETFRDSSVLRSCQELAWRLTASTSTRTGRSRRCLTTSFMSSTRLLNRRWERTALTPLLNGRQPRAAA
jgi:hypothetical protein